MLSSEKRIYWQEKTDWKLLEFSPADLQPGGAGALQRLLKAMLEENGIACNRLSDDEIWDRVRDRAIDRFTAAAVNFVGRCRKRSVSPAGLKELVDSYEPLSPVESQFLELVCTLYAAYLERIAATGEEDFDGLLQRAAEAVSSGTTKFQRRTGSGDLGDLRFVCVDEFQDFSDLFNRLLAAIRQVNTRLELFCVGDDWQAINGFAGSDLRFFERFDEHFGHARRLHISTNYRSAKSIVAVGNALMDGRGRPARASSQDTGSAVVADASAFRPSVVEKQRHPGDVITPMVSRVVAKALADGSDVVMLSRRNALPWFVNFRDQGRGDGKGLSGYLDLVRSLFPSGVKERISISTAHRYKGLEKRTVIVLDAVARSYPLIHPDWAFLRILGDSPEKIIEEERRLLYVALTRAIDKLVIVTDAQGKSPFIEDLHRIFPLRLIDWNEHPPVRGSSSRLVVKVGNQDRRARGPTFAIKDCLKAAAYQWHAAGWPGWAKSFPAEGFRLELLKSEIWASTADGVEVRIFDEGEALIGRFLVRSGLWVTVLDGLAALTEGR